MSLDFDLTDLDPTKRAEVFPPDEQGKMNDALHVLIWILPYWGIGVGQITEKNKAEVWTRIDMRQRLVGSGFTKVSDDGESVEPYLLERKHVDAAVGLRINDVTITKAQFLKNLWEAHQRVHPFDDGL